MLMNKPSSEAEDRELSPVPAAIPPPIRLVHAFKEAAEASKPEADPSQEALSLEVLLIAGDASFAALSRLEDLYHQIIYGGECQGDSVDQSVIEAGYDLWLDAADLLVERMKKLESFCYESESFAAFWKAQAKARFYLDEARDRRRLERQALRNDQLVRLAAKLKTREMADSERGAGG
jgi:hypothetical protein